MILTMLLHMNWFLIYLSFMHVYSLSGQLWWHWSLAHLDFFPVKAVMNRTWQLRPMLNGARHDEFNSHGKYKWRLHWLYKASPRLVLESKLVLENRCLQFTGDAVCWYDLGCFLVNWMRVGNKFYVNVTFHDIEEIYHAYVYYKQS